MRNDSFLQKTDLRHRGFESRGCWSLVPTMFSLRRSLSRASDTNSVTMTNEGLPNTLYVEVSANIGCLEYVLDLTMKVKPHTIFGFLRAPKQTWLKTEDESKSMELHTTGHR